MVVPALESVEETTVPPVVEGVVFEYQVTVMAPSDIGPEVPSLQTLNDISKII